MSFNSTHYPKARKAHRCEECSREIEPGERYSRTAAMWEGEFFTNVACLHCAVARYMVDEIDPYYGESFYGGLSEWLGDGRSEDLAAARLKVCTDRMWQRFDGQGLMSIPPAATDNARIRRHMWLALGLDGAA